MEDAAGLLLVEGQDDQHVIGHLFQHHKVTEFDIQDKLGCHRLLNGSAIRCAGIVLDADEDLMKRWQQTRAILLKAGYQAVPATPTPGGSVISEAGRPNIGVWLMPDHSILGTLG